MTVKDITDWMVAYLTRLLQLSPDQIDTTLTFDCYGIDSKSAAALIGDLSDWLKRDLDLSIFYDYPSIDELSNYLAQATKD